MAKTKFEKLKRLSAMSAPEVLYRLFHWLNEKLSRRRILRGERESVEAFVAKLSGDGASFEDKFHTLFHTLQQRHFFNWQESPPQIFVSRYKKRFAREYEALVATADNACDFQFEIFAQPLQFAEQIDWHYDMRRHKSIKPAYWTDINYYDADIVEEVKFVWEFNRCQHFVTLGRAFYVTGDEKYAQALLYQWQDWIDKNPYKMGINWTSALECAFRLISWTWALSFVRSSQHFHAGHAAHFLQSIQEHAQYIAGHLSQYSSANNHLIGEALGLIYAGCYFPEFSESELWRKSGFAIVFKQIIQQVHADGVSAEQTTYYQKYIFDFGVLALLAAQRAHVAVPQDVHKRLERMAEFSAAIIDGSTIPHIGDDDGGCALRLTEAFIHPYHELLSTAAVLFERADFKAAAGDFTEAPFWLFGETALEQFEKLPTEKDARRLVHFREGGYVVLNQYQPLAQKIIFDCGPLGLGTMAAHGHADALAVTLSVAGRPVFIDCGTYMYLGTKERHYFRSTRAHNSLTIDGDNQSDILGPFQWGRRARTTVEFVRQDNDQIVVRAAHDGYRCKRIVHHRTITARDGLWIIKDVISGLGNHQIDMYFHCHSSNLIQQSRTVELDFSTFRVACQFDEQRKYEDNIGIEEAWHSDRFGQRDIHNVIRRTVTGPLPLELTTTITVYA